MNGDIEPLFDYEDGEELPEPDDLLDIIRGLVRTWVKDGKLTDEQTADLVQATDQLDDWMSTGHALPRAWWRTSATDPTQEAAPGLDSISPSPKYL